MSMPQIITHDPVGASDGSWSKVNENGYECGSVREVDPKPAPESIGKIQSMLWGYLSSWAVRSNKGVAMHLLFRHSLMAIVVKRGIFPPYFMQW